ncbi:MAG TPA: GFA family protein [Cellvibrionaceae bacterium]|nr:GFA family protein [Cellvibrionaceae bacterium]HMW71589.1 GFA family protein [Cellvibrionaceae bacterium]HMY39337.1 GFA family protein [Marinagarivorans sp.]HNG60054.1 GFA family protein [Cellvibrionaceae bacterium]
MTTPYTGGCACGAIRYEINAEPLIGVECHCSDCRHESGNGHASHLVFPRAAARIDGTASEWSMTADSGNIKTRAFCPTCGTPVYMIFAANPAAFSVRAGSLDEPSRYTPKVVTYTSRALAWDMVDSSLPSFTEMPPR